MTGACETVQGLLAGAVGGEAGAGANGDDILGGDADAAAAHLAACRDCQVVAAAVVDLDAWLACLPAIAPPDSLTATTLVAVERAAREPRLAAPLVGAAEAGPSRRRGRFSEWLAWPFAPPSRRLLAVAVAAALVAAAIPNGLRLWQQRAQRRTMSDLITEGSAGATVQSETASGAGAPEGRVLDGSDQLAATDRPGAIAPSPLGNDVGYQGKEVDSRAKKANSRDGQDQMAARQAAMNQSLNAAIYDAVPTQGSPAVPPAIRGHELGEKRVLDVVGGAVDTDRFERVRGDDADRAVAESPPALTSELARRLLPEPTGGAAIQFQEAAGYWSNSYVPGDPTIRLLESRLAAADGLVTGPDGRRRPLAAAARQYRQPFDPPRDSALAVYMHADRRGISERDSRLLLQVGLQATSRSSGLRTAMNVGVVLDLRGEIDRDVSAQMRALVTALNAAQETGDRFSLTVAGRPGGTLVAPVEFKFGAVAVALRQLFGDEPDATVGPTLGLVDAVAAATSLVARGDDPEAPLGASVVLLVTASTLTDDIDALERMANASAVGGIPMSVVACGDRTDADEIDRLTLAGQGNRRALQSPADAADVVDRELHSASRVVARAVRLRIRLAPGVKLVRVLRSQRLDDAGSQQVRDAENSVDLRLARSLGIGADRGDDEEGLQIVIPSYYAGDSHVILLDVVAERAGSIADVTVRYKDLVYLRNGVARDNLSLGSSADGPGPLERNVLKNLVAIRLSDAIREAGGMLEAGEQQAAIATLDEQAQVIVGLRSTVAGWQNDVELLSDLQMIADYRALLAADLSSDDQRRQGLSDSLRYAGHMKVQARRR